MYKLILDDTDTCLARLNYIAGSKQQSSESGGDLGLFNDASLNTFSETIVEKIDGNFMVYKTKPVFSFNSKAQSNFVAHVKVKKGYAIVEIRIKRNDLIFSVIWYIFIILMSIYALYLENFISILFICFLIAFPITLVRARKKFRMFLDKFLNSGE